MRDIAIERVMTTNPASVEANDPIAVAKRFFEVGDIHHLPVVKDGMLVGIVSSSDLLKFHLLDGDPADLSSATVGQIMATEPVVLEIDASLRDAATALSVGGYHALPVIEQDRTLVGIVTTADLVRHLLQTISRHDGSIRDTEVSTATVRISDNEILQATRQAEQSVDQSNDSDILARTLLHFRDRNRLLEKVYKAAELYMRSGHGEHEHSVLMKCLADL